MWRDMGGGGLAWLRGGGMRLFSEKKLAASFSQRDRICFTMTESWCTERRGISLVSVMSPKMRTTTFRAQSYSDNEIVPMDIHFGIVLYVRISIVTWLPLNGNTAMQLTQFGGRKKLIHTCMEIKDL